MPERVGFVGLGIMGRPMAENLARTFTVVGFDARESRLQGLARVETARSVEAMGT